MPEIQVSRYGTTIKAVAVFRHVSYWTILRLVKEGRIPSEFRHGRYFIDTEWFDREREKEMYRQRYLKAN